MVSTATTYSRKVALSEALASFYWREDQARTVLDAWESSGKSLQEFAEQHDVGLERLYRWKSRLSKSKAPVQPQFVRLTLEDVLGSNSRPEGKDAGIEVILPGERRLRLHPRFDAETLRRAVTILEEKQPC